MSLPRAWKSWFAGLLSLGLLVAAGGRSEAGKAEDAKKYAEQLKTSKDPKKRAEALEELGKLAQVLKSLVAPAVPDIVAALKDKDATVRAKAAVAYGRTDPDPKEAVPVLVKMLKEDKSEEVRIGAAQGLGAMGPGARDAVPDLRAVVAEERKKDMKKQTPLARSVQTALQAINERKK